MTQISGATFRVGFEQSLPAPVGKPGDVDTLPRRGERAVVRGKFLYVGDNKLWVRGVTYGTFRPDGDGNEYLTPSLVEKDFAAMVANGINTVRTYTVPPRWLMDIAERHGLQVMVGLPWEQHMAFLSDSRQAGAIVARVREQARSCAGHPALLCYAIGNEIPAPIVRWHGRRRIERFLYRLYRAVKKEDPTALLTYVNFPTTEYLQLPFIDFVCFNVYLESQDRLAAYLARLQNLAGERPLVLAEIGLDSCRNGEMAQAKSLAWQIKTAFACGCAGAFVFSWTDEWYRGGHDIDDWSFGLTTRERQPKPALTTVRRAYAEIPFARGEDWPLVSVVVCSYNGARTIRDTLEALSRLDYPNYEVIVVNDGSQDTTATIAAEYDVRLISTVNRGLSNARNTGWQAARGEIVAYIDDDAYPDSHWLTFLAATFRVTDHVGVGGPNLAPPGDGSIADCVANAPGGPVHVLISDQEAEHIPGCNMAFRRSALESIGGFDSRYRVAGDDVDLCWRLQQNGGSIGFHAAAVVWHHRRNSLRMYWRQQQGYGKAEALLEEKWPERYNAIGHLSWTGKLYGKGLTKPVPLGRSRIYQGTWGFAPFQFIYEPEAGTLLSLPLMPEWYLVIALLAVFTFMGISWPLLLLALPLLLGAVALPMTQAIISASRARFTSNPKTVLQCTLLYGLTAFLHLQQPLARLIGRLRHGLSPWRRRSLERIVFPYRRTVRLWSEQWKAPESWLATLQQQLRAQKAVVLVGGDYDRWDLQVRGGPFCSLNTLMAIEEHGSGRQMIRFCCWPRISKLGLGLFLLFSGLALGAGLEQAWVAAIVLACAASMISAQAAASYATAVRAWYGALAKMEPQEVTAREEKAAMTFSGMLAWSLRIWRSPNTG